MQTPSSVRGGVSSSDYGSASYWDERYAFLSNLAASTAATTTPASSSVLEPSDADMASYDWYLDYASLKNYLAPHLRRDAEFEILITGCGTSTLGADLSADGYHQVTNIDTSAVVVSHMAAKYAHLEDVEFTVMDARNMNYIPSDCFDCVIDKALFDALLCGETNTADVQAYLEEVHRVIKPGGVFVLISHGAPASRMPHFQLSMAQTQGISVASNSGNTPASGSVQGQPLGGGCKWSIDHHEIPRPFLRAPAQSDGPVPTSPFHVYACRKTE